MEGSFLDTLKGMTASVTSVFPWFPGAQAVAEAAETKLTDTALDQAKAAKAAIMQTVDEAKTSFASSAGKWLVIGGLALVVLLFLLMIGKSAADRVAAKVV